MKYLSVILIVFLFSACCSQKKVISKEEVAKVSQAVEQMQEQGYHKGVIIFNAQKSNPCNYLIKINDSLTIEPRQELKIDFKKDKQVVWVKYHPQRRMSRCQNSQPVEIIDIKITDN